MKLYKLFIAFSLMFITCKASNIALNEILATEAMLKKAPAAKVTENKEIKLASKFKGAIDELKYYNNLYKIPDPDGNGFRKNSNTINPNLTVNSIRKRVIDIFTGHAYGFRHSDAKGKGKITRDEFIVMIKALANIARASGPGYDWQALIKSKKFNTSDDAEKNKKIAVHGFWLSLYLEYFSKAAFEYDTGYTTMISEIAAKNHYTWQTMQSKLKVPTGKISLDKIRNNLQKVRSIIAKQDIFPIDIKYFNNVAKEVEAPTGYINNASEKGLPGTITVKFDKKENAEHREIKYRIKLDDLIPVKQSSVNTEDKLEFIKGQMEEKEYIKKNPGYEISSIKLEDKYPRFVGAKGKLEQYFGFEGSFRYIDPKTYPVLHYVLLEAPAAKNSDATVTVPYVWMSENYYPFNDKHTSEPKRRLVRVSSVSNNIDVEKLIEFEDSLAKKLTIWSDSAYQFNYYDLLKDDKDYFNRMSQLRFGSMIGGPGKAVISLLSSGYHDENPKVAGMNQETINRKLLPLSEEPILIDAKLLKLTEGYKGLKKVETNKTISTLLHGVMNQGVKSKFERFLYSVNIGSENLVSPKPKNIKTVRRPKFFLVAEESYKTDPAAQTNKKILNPKIFHPYALYYYSGVLEEIEVVKETDEFRQRRLQMEKKLNKQLKPILTVVKEKKRIIKRISHQLPSQKVNNTMQSYALELQSDHDPYSSSAKKPEVVLHDETKQLEVENFRNRDTQKSNAANFLNNFNNKKLNNYLKNNEEINTKGYKVYTENGDRYIEFLG